MIDYINKLNNIIDDFNIDEKTNICEEANQFALKKLGEHNEFYRMYLLDYKGNYILDNLRIKNNSNVSKYSNGILLNCFFDLYDGVNNIYKNNKSIKNEFFPKNAIAIGDVAGGDYLYIIQDSSEIYLWNHEASNEESQVKIANNFSDFLNMFFESENIINGNDVTTTYSDDFIKMMKG